MLGETADASPASLPPADEDDPGAAEEEGDPPAIPMPVTLTPTAVSFAFTGVAAPTSSGGAYWLGVVYSM